MVFKWWQASHNTKVAVTKELQVMWARLAEEHFLKTMDRRESIVHANKVLAEEFIKENGRRRRYECRPEISKPKVEVGADDIVASPPRVRCFGNWYNVAPKQGQAAT